MKKQYKKIYLLGFVMLLWVTCLFAQAPDTLWTRTYGGTRYQEGISVQQTSDGGFIIVGYTDFTGNGDVYLIKTDANGDSLWTKIIGGEGGDNGWAVFQTADDGFIITGSFGAGNGDVYLLKTDANGDTLWTRTYGGPESDYGRSVQQTFDGGYIVVGETESYGAGICDVYLIKTDANGDTLWTKTYGGTYSEGGWSVQQTADRGYIIAGQTASFGAGTPTHPNLYLIKTDSLGDTLWTKVYGGTDSEVGRSVQQTTDGGYIIAGNTGSYGAGYLDVYLIKTDVNGDILWTRTFGGTNYDIGRSVFQCSDKGYVVAGETRSFGAGLRDVYIVRTDSLGDTLWTKTCGGVYDDVGFSGQQTSDKGYIIAGFYTYVPGNNKDVYLIKIAQDNVGIEISSFSALLESHYIKLQWRAEMEDGCLQYLILKKSNNEDEEYSEIAKFPGTGFSSSPQNYFYIDKDVQPGIRYYYKLGVVKENGSTNWYGPVSAVVTGTKPFLSISPNPFTQKTVIRYSSIVNSKDSHPTPYSLRIYDTCGRLVKRFTIDDSRFSDVTWDGRDDNGKILPSGIYYIKLTQGSLTETKKLLFVK